MKCFIIMKFGQTQDEQMKSLNKYRVLIERACLSAGYSTDEITRADIESVTGGNMDRQLINELAAAELVVADITDSNPNVFYELGIRHALKRRGTLIIKDINANIPFDIAKTYVHSYRYDIDYITQEVEAIAGLIKIRRSNTIDSPVHEWLDLAPDLTEVHSDDHLKTIEELRLKNSELENEIVSLTEKLENLPLQDPFATLVSTDYLQIDFSQAEQYVQFSGSSIIRRLTTCVAANDIEKFKQEIMALQDHVEYVDWNDFRIIADLCKEFDLLPYQITILEYADQKYPNNTKIKIDLIDAYNNSPSARDKDKAVKLVENHFLISHDENNMPFFMPKAASLHIDEGAFATIANTYIHRGEYDALLSITLSAQNGLHLTGPIFRRNLATAYRMLGDNDKAIKISKEIILEFPSSQEFHKLSKSYYNQMDCITGYLLSEMAAIVDPKQPEHYISLAIDIFNNQVARTEGGVVQVGRGDVLKHMVALLYYALELSHSEETVTGVLRVLIQAHGKDEADYVFEQVNNHNYQLIDTIDSSRYNMSPLNYIVEKSKSEIDIGKEIDSIFNNS